MTIPETVQLKLGMAAEVWRSELHNLMIHTYYSREHKSIIVCVLNHFTWQASQTSRCYHIHTNQRYFPPSRVAKDARTFVTNTHANNWFVTGTPALSSLIALLITPTECNICLRFLYRMSQRKFVVYLQIIMLQILGSTNNVQHDGHITNGKSRVAKSTTRTN